MAEAVPETVEMTDAEQEWEELDEDGKLKKQVLVEGTGWQQPGDGHEVFVHYTGWLLDGTKFDSSRDRDQEFTFKLGAGSVIKGWDKALRTMKKGEKSNFIIHPDLAYGSAGAGASIPGGATLKFEIELIRWESEEKVTEDGRVTMEVLQEGEGWDRPKDETTCVVHLRGRVVDGSEDQGKLEGADVCLEDTRDEFPDGKTVVLGDEEVMDGVDECLRKMKKGAKVRATIRAPHNSTGGVRPDGVGSDSVVEYEIELVSFKKAPESYSMEGEVRLDTCEARKDSGNDAFRAGRLSLALKRYDRGLKYLEAGKFSEAEKKRKRGLEAAVHSNRAAILLKQKRYQEAAEAAEKALKNERRNVKALYRRSMALGQMGYYEDALRHLGELLSVDAENGEALRLKAALEARQAAQDRKDRGMFRRMLA